MPLESWVNLVVALVQTLVVLVLVPISKQIAAMRRDVQNLSTQLAVHTQALESHVEMDDQRFATLDRDLQRVSGELTVSRANGARQ